MDAYIKLKSRWDTLRSTLSKQGIQIPESPLREGYIFKENKITIGIWIMPNNDLTGMLEDFIAFLIPTDHRLLDVVKKTLTSIEAENLNLYASHPKNKAKIH